MINYDSFFKEIEKTNLKPWLKTLPSQLEKIIPKEYNSNFLKWTRILKQLPPIKPSFLNLQSDTISIGTPSDINQKNLRELKNTLRLLHPWRKGPYNIFGIHIDTEWRSDWKWNKLKNEIQPLTGRLVLDVGCGNGYHCWRMAGAGAKLVVGIDPVMLYIVQFQAVKSFAQKECVHLLPIVDEMLPDNLNAFDTVFSMGVLYHRRSPVDHLLKIRSCLIKGGELILETLVIDGGSGQILIPEERYAKMKNIWLIPTCNTLKSLLKRCGYKNIQLIKMNKTSVKEQRSTEWMTFESLSDFLDKNNPNLTVEGHPAPKRAIFRAEKY